MIVKKKKIKIPRLRAKATLIGFSLFSALLLTLFVSFITADVEPSFFESEVLSRGKEILGTHEELYPVVRVTDGDTFVVRVQGVEEKVRLLGIDAPETRDPRKPVECFGEEATLRMRELLDDQFVRLESDASQADRDRYGRLLRYVYLADGTFLNDLLLREGYAFEYTYESQPYLYQESFMLAEVEAQERARGMWGPSGCGAPQQ